MIDSGALYLIYSRKFTANRDLSMKRRSFIQVILGGVGAMFGIRPSRAGKVAGLTAVSASDVTVTLPSPSAGARYTIDGVWTTGECSGRLVFPSVVADKDGKVDVYFGDYPGDVREDDTIIENIGAFPVVDETGNIV